MAATPTPARLYVDGHNLLHRAAFGFPARITSRNGRDITLVFGFFALMRAGARSLPTPPEIIVIFDGQDGAADRRALLPEYKPPVSGDDEIFADLPLIYQGLDRLSVHYIEDNRYEADDVIASLIAARPHRAHVIMSTDKDFYQLLSHNICVLNSQRRADRRIVRPSEVLDKHGVTPGQWCDYRALTGDPSDNIPGIRGVGPATAARLLADGAHIEDLDKPGHLTGRTGNLIRNQWDNLLLWRTLIKLRTDIPVPATETTSSPLPPAPDIVGDLGLWNASQRPTNERTHSPIPRHDRLHGTP